MKKSIVIGLHLGFWLLYIFVTVLLIGLHSESQELIGLESFFEDTLRRAFFFTFLPSVISFYTFYSLVFYQLRCRHFMRSVVYGLAASVGAAVLGTALVGVVLGMDILVNAKESPGVGVLFVSVVDLLVGVAALLIKGFLTWYEELKMKEELQQKNHEMEMALIKAQLDPHFLFNTLNNIDILILKNPTEASDYLNHLCDIMRFMLYETKTAHIALNEEIAYIQKYIALQRLRTANPNYVHFEWTGNPQGHRIAPLIFLPFIENAFKHSTNKKKADAIRIHLKIANQRVELQCINKFNPNRPPPTKSGGLGNQLIIRRLGLIYPGRHTLNITRESDTYNVCLNIQLNFQSL